MHFMAHVILSYKMDESSKYKQDEVNTNSRKF